VIAIDTNLLVYAKPSSSSQYSRILPRATIHNIDTADLDKDGVLTASKALLPSKPHVVARLLEKGRDAGSQVLVQLQSPSQNECLRQVARIPA
jgi:hypothetical protein